MTKKIIIPAIIASIFTTSLFAETISFKAITDDSTLDGKYIIKKIDSVTFGTEDGAMIIHKLKSLKQASLLDGVRVYEGVERIEQKGKSEVMIHFLGKIEPNGHEYGFYTKFDEKTKKIIGRGLYTYDK